MSQVFNSRSGLILVEAEVSGPTGKVGATPVLDTRATSTILNCSLLRSIDDDPDTAPAPSLAIPSVAFRLRRTSRPTVRLRTKRRHSCTSPRTCGSLDHW